MNINSSYLNSRFIACINKDNVHTIVECGSRDGLDAIALYEYYQPEKIYAFECNPEAIELCKENLSNYPDIKLIEKAVYNENKEIDFYAVDMEKSIDKNIGASSILWHRDNKVELFQKKIKVGAIRLDTFMKKEGIDRINLLCMDVQGVEMEVFEGLGNDISNIRYIITETCFEHFYEGDKLLGDMRKYLDEKGFNLLVCSGFIPGRRTGFTNCLFRNKRR